MKAIMISIQSPHACNILNDIKILEIRKKFPKDYVGWVYIYVTKSKPYLSSNSFEYYVVEPKQYEKYMGNWNGKVLARFWCDKVEEIKSCDVPFTFEQTITDFYTDTFNDMDDLLKASCLDYYSLEQYLRYAKTGYAINITKLEIFDKPKEISEFMKVSCKGCPFENTQTCHNNTDGRYCRLTHAPQSWCYVEV